MSCGYEDCTEGAMTFHLRYASGKTPNPERFCYHVRYGYPTSLGYPYYYNYAVITCDTLDALKGLAELVSDKPKDRSLIITFDQKVVTELGLPLTINEIIVYDDYVE